MSWIRGTATDYKDLSDVLHEAAVGNSVQTVDSIAAGGTGYTVGEIITLTGGTFSVAAQLEVLTLSGSAVATVRIYNAGVYTVDPTDPVAQGSSDGSGTGATFNLTLAANGWTSLRNQQTAISSVDSVVSGGSGYITNEIITLSGGTYSTVATLRVTGHTGGVIDTVSIEDAGVYSILPTDPVAQLSSDGAGTGATFNLTWAAGEKDVILKGNGGGTDEIFVGWRTLSGAGFFNFELHGFTGFDALLPHTDQIGISPGQWDHITTSLQAGAYMLCQSTPLTYWLSINSYRIILVTKVGTAYFNAYLGFGNRFGTVTEYPYPLCISGHTSYAFSLSNQSKITSGLIDPWTASENNAAGPMFVMMLDNTWKSVSNGVMGSTLGAAIVDSVSISPTAQPDGTNSSGTPPEDKFLDSGLEWNDIILNEATGTPEFNMSPIPGTAEKHMIIPCTLISTDPSSNVLIELDSVYWMSSFNPSGLVQTEDRIIDGADTYRVFQNCNRTNSYAFLAIKEA